MEKIIKQEILFEVNDVFGKKIHTTKDYWTAIFQIKHKELTISEEPVIKAISNPDEVRQSFQDHYINLFYKKINRHYLVVVVKYLNGSGFVITVYKTSKVKRKGEILWQRQKPKKNNQE